MKKILLILLINFNLTIMEKYIFSEYSSINDNDLLLSDSPHQDVEYYKSHPELAPNNPFFQKFFDEFSNVDLNPMTVNHESTKKKREIFDPKYIQEIKKFKIPEKYPKPILKKNQNEIISEIYNLPIEDNKKTYLDTLAFRESSYRPHVENQFGYYGLYQIGDSVLRQFGYKKEDLKDTSKQHEVTLKLADFNEKILKNIINSYENEIIDGIKITKNGILAAAHLLGANSVKDYFNNTEKTSIAKRGFIDGNGVHISEYFKLFDD